MPRPINTITVTMTPSADRARALLIRRILEVCALCVFILIGAARKTRGGFLGESPATVNRNRRHRKAW